MPGRGPQTFKKRQKEQQRKDRQQEKMEKRLARKHETDASAATGGETSPEPDEEGVGQENPAPDTDTQ